MKALVISPQPFFSPRGTPFSVYYRLLAMAKFGVDIDLLTYGEGRDIDIPHVNIIRIPHFPFLGNIKVGPSLLKLFLDCFIFVWAVYLLCIKRYDVIFAHEESVFLSMFMKPIFRFKFVYEMHSSLPQQLKNFDYTNSVFLTRIFKNLERRCLAQADAVVTICPELASYAMSHMKDTKRHFLIENSCFDPVKLKNNSSVNEAQRAIIDLPRDRSLIVYAGTFEEYQGLDILILAFKFILQKRPDAFLLMIGGTPRQISRLQELANKNNLEGNILFTGILEQALVKEYLALAKVLVSCRTQGTNVPLKIYEQLASGIPLVATRILSHTQVLTDKVCIFVEPNPISIAEGILEALNNRKRSEEIARNAALLYKEKYSKDIYEKKMKQLLEVLK